MAEEDGDGELGDGDGDGDGEGEDKEDPYKGLHAERSKLMCMGDSRSFCDLRITKICTMQGPQKQIGI